MFLVPFLRGLARQSLLACLALTAATASVFAQTNTPSAADGFDPNVDGNVYAIIPQPADGKLIVVGQFANLQPNGGIGSPRNNIARINPDGTIDPDFNPNVNGAIRAAVLQRDGSIVIGGDFSSVGGVPRDRIARLKPTGALDTTFSPSIVGVSVDTNVALNPQVLALALQSDGHILVGGTFGAIKGTGAATAVTRNNIARLDGTGVVDAFNPNANGMVLAVAVQPSDGKIVVGGAFTAIQATTRLHAARLNPDGSVDSQFDPKPDNGVTAIKIQPDGKILLGGYFTTIQPLQADNVTVEPSPISRSHIARLNADAPGSNDSEFYPVIGGNVLTIDLSLDGGILVGGHFTQVSGRGNVGASRSYVARFSNDGTLDQAFNPGVNGDVDAFAFQPDGKIVIGGYFTRAQAAGLSAAIVRNRLARVLPNGALDTAFQVDQGGRILASVVQTDKSIVVAGTFTNIGGVSRNYIARLTPDGKVDAGYNPNLNGPVYTLAYDSAANKVLAGGSFTTVGGEIRNHLVRLNSIGTLDSEFNPNINGGVGSIILQPDGNILVAGSFSTVQPLNATTSTARANILRLTNAGQLDANFNPTPNNSISAMALQSDGKILIGGGFTSLQPGATGNLTGRSFIARLNSDGTIDTSYNPNANGPVSAIALQSDNKAVIGGRFTAFLPNSTSTIIARNFIARVNTDGTIDADFDPHANNLVIAIAVQPDQKIVIGGLFTTLQPKDETDWTLRKYVARLTPAGKVDSAFNLDLNEQPGGRVDSLNVLGNEDLLVGGTFISLQPVNTTTRIARNHFARITNSAVASFDPVATGTPTANVKAIAIQPDSKILVGGDFSDLGGATSKSIARFNPEGSADNTFNAALSTNGVVNAIAIRATLGASTATQVGGFGWFESNGTLRTSFKPTIKVQGQISTAVVQADGKVVLGGTFTDFSNQTYGNLIRFNADGTLDSGFTPKVSGSVFSIQIQSDGKLIIVGNFTSVNDTTRNYVARLDKTTGAPDAFDPNANGAVYSALLQDNAVVLGGAFTTLTPTVNGVQQTAITRNYLARVSTVDGSVDSTFDPNLNSTVYSLALQSPDKKILAGGNFTTVQPNGAASTTTRHFIARFNSDGTLDQNFDPNANGTIYAVAFEASDSKILLGGSFTLLQPTIGGTLQAFVTRNYIARVNSDGAVDTTFDPNTNGLVSSIAISADGQTLLLGGNFTVVQPNGSSIPIARNFAARISNNGLLDTTFNPDVAGNVSIVAFGSGGSVLIGGSFTTLQPNGVILVGGKFTDIGGIAGTNANLAQLNGDGSVNASFQPNPNGAINALLPLPDGSFLVGGDFTNIQSTARGGIALFTNQGVLDTNFTPPATSGVTVIAVQSNGLYLAGTRSAAGLIRLNTNGTLDTSFTAAVPFVGALALAVQPDGKIIVAGPVSTTGGRVARLNTDGSLDNTFAGVTYTPADAVQTLTLQTDGSIVLAGSFKNLNGSFNGLARLKSDGTFDSSFNPNVNDTVSAVALQSDGRLVFGGAFTSVGGLQRVGLARIGNTAPAPQTIGIAPDGKTVTLIRRANGTAANTSTAGELIGVSFEQSTDLLTWTTLGLGKRIAGTPDWQVTNVAPPADTDTFHSKTDTYYIRARGISPSSAGKSASVYEVVQVVNLASRIAGSSVVVAPVVSSVAWDQAHYVWTQDAGGILRIVDSSSLTALDTTQSVLIGNESNTSSSSTRLADLSTLGTVTTSTPLIGGFAITGTGSRTVLVRAVGPGLIGFGVTDTLAAPQLRLYNNSTGAVIGSNNGWNNDPALAAAFAHTGAFPFASGSADSALLITLTPGTYSVQAIDGSSAAKGGSALVEVYDAGDLADTTARVTNLSSRGTVSNRGALVGGLVITGSTTKTLLVRGIGPSLAHYGVSGVLADPIISVYDSQGHVLATNDNWWITTNGTISGAIYSAALSSAEGAVGAFSLDAGSKDAALVVTVPAGAYSVQVTGVDGSAGAAMIEVYELP